MEDKKKIINDLTQKDEVLAKKAAEIFASSGDKELFEILTEKMQFLFPFVKNNVERRLENAFNQTNFKKILDLFEIYSSDFDELFCKILAKYANEDLTDEIIEIFENGSEAQKAYCAKYFSFIKDTCAIELLISYSSSDFEPLSINCATSLGKMNERTSFDKNILLLKSDDEFEKFKAVKFLVAYGDKSALAGIFEAMKASITAENIASEIPYLENLFSLIKNENNIDALICLDNIVDGLAEIIPLSDIVNFEFLDIFNFLIKSSPNSKIAQVLLNAYLKFETIANCEEYYFDEDKDTKNSITEIYAMFKKLDENFWIAQKDLIIDELYEDEKSRLFSAIEVVKNYKIKESKDRLLELVEEDDELIKFQAINALKAMDFLDEVSVNIKFKNQTLQAVFDSYFL